MRGRILRVVSAFAAVAALGLLVNAGALRADDDRNNDGNKGNRNDDGGSRPGQTIPPQTLPQGFESHSDLAHDASQSRHAAQYSAWVVESSRFMRVPFRSFMPDRGDKPTVNLPVNLGIIKAKNGDITLYDSGWKQLSYIYDWQFPSCCWHPIRMQMTKIGLNPDKVKRIVVGHAHWDHAGQLSEFPDAVLYIQKEELKQIDFFLSYPLRFNGGHIRAVNTVDPITGNQVGPPAQACARSPVCGYPPQTVQEILGKVLAGKAQIVDGRHEVAPG